MKKCNSLHLVSLFLLATFVSSPASAWVGPSMPPPLGDADAPLNSGFQGQVKAAGLTIGTALDRQVHTGVDPITGATTKYYQPGLWIPEGLIGLGTIEYPGYRAGTQASGYTDGDSRYRLTVNGNILATDSSGGLKGKIYANAFCLGATDTNCRSDWAALSASGVGTFPSLARWAGVGSPNNLLQPSNLQDDGVMVSLKPSGAPAITKPFLFLDRTAAPITATTFSPIQNQAALYVRTDSSYPLEVDAPNGPALSVDQLGRVGLGKTNPSERLDVVGNLKISGTATATTYCIGNSCIKSWPSGGSANAFVQSGNSFGASATLGTNDNQALIFESNNTERMRINAGGNVGVGVDPLARFHILQTAGGWSDGMRISNGSNQWNILADGGAINPWLTIAPGVPGDYANGFVIRNGRVGLGTEQPNGRLDLFENNQRLTFLMNRKLTGTWPPVSETTTMTIQSTGSAVGNLAFATGNEERMRIANNGNVGIGTTPGSTYKLDVAGALRVSGGDITSARSSPSASDVSLGVLAGSDSFYRMAVLSQWGSIMWGSGAAAQDTNLYRASANNLKTDDSFTVAQNLSVIGKTTTSGGLVIETRNSASPGGGRDPASPEDGRIWLVTD